MPTYPADVLLKFSRALFEAAGVPSDAADTVATSLVEAELRGLESHGLMRAARYIGRIQRSELQAAARPVIGTRNGACAVIDGGWGFGQVAAHFGVRTAIELCREHGQAGVSVGRAHHVGRIGEYAEALAHEGLACIVMSGGGERGGAVAPYGSRARALGTNPLAMAVPTPAGTPPLVLDFATSVVPEGRIAVAAANGQPAPAGCLIDRDGKPTTNPAAFWEGGALLPFGGHKGSALALMIEILATTLAGSMPICSPDFRMGNPTLILAWAVDRFTPLASFEQHVTNLVTHLQNSPPAEGFNEVLLPGEIEARNRVSRLANGIRISDAAWAELTTLAASLGVTAPAAQ